MFHFENILVPIAFFFLLYKLFTDKKPSFIATVHCLVIFLLLAFLHFYVHGLLSFTEFTSMHIAVLLNSLLIPSIFLYILFFRENKEYDELLKKDIWQHWTDEPIHKKEGL